MHILKYSIHKSSSIELKKWISHTHTHTLIVSFLCTKNEENLQTEYMNKDKTKEVNDCRIPKTFFIYRKRKKPAISITTAK